MIHPKISKHLKDLQNNPNGFAQNYNLGVVFHEAGNLKRAEKFFRRAVEIDPKNSLAYNDIGVVYMDLEKPNLALKNFKKALQLNESFSGAIYNVGYLYSKYKSKTKLAKKYFKKAYELDNKNSKALAMYYQSIRGSGNLNLREKLEKKLDKLTNEEIKNKNETGEFPFLNLTRKQDDKQNFEIAKRWGLSFPRRRESSDYFYGSRIKSGMTRVGYVSDGLRDFPTGHNFSSVIANHSKNIHVNIYTWGEPDNSAYEELVKKRSDNYVDISELTNHQAAEKISQDKIDILIDLKGWTSENRMEIFSYKPAPIIVNYLGYPGTSGSKYHGFLIADKYVIPKENKKYFSEKIIYLPHCYRPADTITPVIVNSKSETRNSKRFIFGSLNTEYKINRQIYETWLDILEAVPNSQLWILSENKNFKNNLKHSQIKFIKFLDKQKHLERLSEIDLCLDTKIVSGHTTTTDAARVGVPTLCLKGKHFASRVSESINYELGLEELIAKDLEEYKNKAIKLTKSQKEFQKIKRKLIINFKKSIISNPNAFAKSLEKVYFSLVNNEQ